jgi:hypothetical protein
MDGIKCGSIQMTPVKHIGICYQRVYPLFFGPDCRSRNLEEQRADLKLGSMKGFAQTANRTGKTGDANRFCGGAREKMFHQREPGMRHCRVHGCLGARTRYNFRTPDIPPGKPVHFVMNPGTVRQKSASLTHCLETEHLFC